MKNFKTIFIFLGIFLILSTLLVGVQLLLHQQGIIELSFKIHFLIFFITFIVLMTSLIVYGLGYKNVIGFLFLAFIIFKFFAMVYIALTESSFRLHVLPYFIIYWTYLFIEVFMIVKIIEKQD